ncbi:hypothetical protein C8Q80DRAFT_1122967 [Daedaleopsis nitida]|nr:hypothetical protein C8Q80DRAFT_1122967 [Daedaleopsis nitida]
MDDPSKLIPAELSCSNNKEVWQKVDNWFNNKNNIVEEKTIRDQVDTQRSKDATERLNNWNKIWRELYNSLTPKEQQEYIDKADLWNQQGPDARYKPIIANCHAAPWHRAVAQMMLDQCGMLLFMYELSEMENPKPESDLEPVRFELLAWGNNREMGAANYRQPFVPINQKRRGRKVKATTTFSGSSGKDDEYNKVIHGKSAPRAAAGSGAGKKSGGGRKKKSKLKRGAKCAAEEEEEAQSSDTGNDESGEDRPWNHGEETFEFDEQLTSAGEDEDVEDQVVGETVEDNAKDEEDEEEDNTGANFEVGPPSAHIKTYPRAPGKTAAALGPTKSKGKNVKGKEKVTTEQDLVIGPSRVAPFMLKTSPGRKLEYFRVFSAMSEYPTMITRVEEHVHLVSLRPGPRGLKVPRSLLWLLRGDQEGDASYEGHRQD